MNPYLQLVSDYARFNKEARSFPLGTFPLNPHKAPSPNSPKVLIFSPHPDDEVIVGGIALRLLCENQWHVINVAVTQGSKKVRQAPRFEELTNCCRYIGFDLIQTAPNGLESINPKAREKNPANWVQSVRIIAEILADNRPNVVLFPHELDWNSTHIGTHFLVTDALKTLPGSFDCFVVETEFWGQMSTPNLMVEIPQEALSEMMTALTFHVGEVQRNPYHLSLPAWMMDNVRRGSELVGGQGGAAPEFPFATLYRLRRWKNGQFEEIYAGGKQVSASDDVSSLFAGEGGKR